MRETSRCLIGAMATAVMSVAPLACAQVHAPRPYDLAEQDLKYSLRAVARDAGLELVATADLLEGRRGKALRGQFTPEQAIEQLLDGSELVADFVGDTVYIRRRTELPRTDIREEQGVAADIVVTGSRIRGAPIASPSITIDRETMRATGQTSMADVIRHIPQNFGGGQNAGVGLNVPESNGVNTGGASTLNLRGLGSDATLTLLNGHRLSYSAAAQAIDVSAIPVAAVERIEIVADGASALYGSDSVAGVANIVLRRDFDGFETSARLGVSTDGGNAQQQYGAVGGNSWSSGGFIAAYEFGRTTPVKASQRSYAATHSPGLYLYPAIKRHNLVASAHQSLGSGMTLEIDGLYNHRRSNTQYALDPRGDVLANGARTFFRTTSFAIAPTLRIELEPDWSIALTGMYGEDRTRYGVDLFSQGNAIFQQRGCYCNKARSLELATSGTLFDLAAGPARIAVGGGFRSNDFRSSRDGATTIDVSQDTYYAFGELNLPLLSPEQNSGLGHRLNLSAALRYENYPGVDEVVTPKLGLVYSPIRDLDLKASWGRSFKAPRLFEQYNVQFATLYTAASRGGSGFPADATALLLTGGNPDLKPERATTWSVTVAARPQALAGLRLEASYFDIAYRDRIVTPIPFPSRSLADPIYADLVDFAPSPADLAAIIANAGLFQNATASPYDPAKVVAIIRDTSLNAARQSIHGVDGTITYDHRLASGGTVNFTVSGSYIRSQQRRSPLQPVTDIAGTIFNIPHFRARGGIVWTEEDGSLALFINHVGSVRDLRSATPMRVGSMTTVDLAARYRIKSGHGLLDNLGFAVTVSNLLDERPSLIRSTLPFEAPYDTTNQNAFGRVVSFEISKTW